MLSKVKQEKFYNLGPWSRGYKPLGHCEQNSWRTARTSVMIFDIQFVFNEQMADDLIKIGKCC